MVAQELSTPASTTTRTRNMAVQQSGRTSAAAHTAWQRPLICAVSIAATLCCFFVPGAVSPMPPYIPAERGRAFLEACENDSLENHPPTLLDNPPVLEEVFDVVRESYPLIDEVLKRDFMDTNAELDEPSNLALTSQDVERYLAAARPNLRENAAKCLWGIKKKDFDEMARALLRHTYLDQTFSYGKALNDFIREDDLKHEMQTKFRRGYVTASDEKQDHYSAKPSDVSDDLETWVQANIRFGPARDTVDVKLTVHPNVKPNEPEGSILCSTATYKKKRGGGFEKIRECYEVKDVDHANSTGKPGGGAQASAKFKNITPFKKILDHELENSMNVTKFHKTKILGKDGNFAKGALGLTQMSGNDKYMTLRSETDYESVPAVEEAFLEVNTYGGREEYLRSDELRIQRDAGTEERQFKTFDIGRYYALMNSDCLDKPFYKKPASSPSSEEARDKGEYVAKLGIRQDYVFDDQRNRIIINFELFVENFGTWGVLESPISFNLKRIVQPAPPGGKDKTIEVNYHFAYRTDEHKSVLHIAHRTPEEFKSGSFEYPTKHSSISWRCTRGVAFPEDNNGTTEPIMVPLKFEDGKKTCERQSNKRKGDDDPSEASSVNDEEYCSKAKTRSPSGKAALSINGPDGKGQKSSLLGTTLFDGGLLVFGIITLFVLLAVSLECTRKGKRVRMIQGRVVESSKK